MDKERVPLDKLTDRQIAEETLTYLRTFADVLQMVGSNPMVSMMIPGGMPYLTPPVAARNAAIDAADADD